MNVRAVLVGVAIVACAGEAGVATTGPPSEPLRRRAFEFAYNLEYDEAMVAARQAVGTDPRDPANHLALASVTWLKMLALRGAVTVEPYLGPPPKGNLQRTPPPPELAGQFKTAADAALAIAEARVRKDPGDVDAHYVLGAAVGRLAAFTASEEGRIRASIGSARRAFDAHERVLDLDPRRKDAGLVVGTYRYMVASLPLFKRWFAYLAGFGGKKELAMKLLSESAAYASDVQTDSKFALLVVYAREERFESALRLLQDLRARYPRNRLLWLETGAMHLRAGRAAEALAWINDGMARLLADARPRTFGEEAMWHYKRGSALAALRRVTEARADADAALALPGQRWLRGRVHILEGHIEDVAGNRAAAMRAYERGRSIARQTGDRAGEEDAEHWLDTPYTGTSGTAPRQYR